VPWVVELTGVIGHYGMITGLLNASRWGRRPTPSSCRSRKRLADGAQPP